MNSATDKTMAVCLAWSAVFHAAAVGTFPLIRAVSGQPSAVPQPPKTVLVHFVDRPTRPARPTPPRPTATAAKPVEPPAPPVVRPALPRPEPMTPRPDVGAPPSEPAAALPAPLAAPARPESSEPPPAVRIARAPAAALPGSLGGAPAPGLLPLRGAGGGGRAPGGVGMGGGPAIGPVGQGGGGLSPGSGGGAKRVPGGQTSPSTFATPQDEESPSRTRPVAADEGKVSKAPSAPPAAAETKPDAEELRAFRTMVQTKIESAKRYPPAAAQAGVQGQVRVTFRLGRNGQPGDVVVSGSSGSPSLDRAAEDAIRRAAPFLPVPASLAAGSAKLTVSVKFELG